nr:hypothetical protein Q903MT_gene4849 [Picea sitchensis]
MAGHGYHIDNIDPFFRLFIHSLVTDMIRVITISFWGAVRAEVIETRLTSPDR